VSEALSRIGGPAALLTLFAAGFAYASWRAARPADPARPRMAPWRTVSVALGFAAFVALLVIIAELRAPS